MHSTNLKLGVNFGSNASKMCKLCVIGSPGSIYALSDAHFHQFPVIDQLKSQMTSCSCPPQDLGPIKIQFWWSRISLFLWCCEQACYFPTKFKPWFSTKDRCVDQCIRTAKAPCSGGSKWPFIVYHQSTLCF